MKKIARKFMILIMTSIMIIMALPLTTQAASKKVIPLKAGKTYTAYDFTGDGKKDRFKYVTYRNGSEYAKVYINGKYRSTLDLARGGARSPGRGVGDDAGRSAAAPSRPPPRSATTPHSRSPHAPAARSPRTPPCWSC